jgi:drug/metabolite transporter (DMT)-like permease
MLDLVLGIVAAMIASTLYSLGIALQAYDAKRAPQEDHLRPALVLGLIQRARWMLGTGLSVLGFPFQVTALLLAPLVVVQPALAFGLVVLLVLAERMLGEHSGRYEYLAMAAILLGVLGAALCAPPSSTHHTSQELTITLVLVGLAALSLLPYLLSALGHQWPELAMLGAGMAFGWSAVATKLASDDLHNGHLLPAALWALSTAAASIVGVLSEMSSLQARPAIQVAPVVFVTQTAVPLVLGPLLLGESFSHTPAGGVPLALSLAVLVAGAAALARSPLLLAVMAAERVSPDSDSTPNPSPEASSTIRSMPDSDPLDGPASTTTTSPARS